MGLKFFLSFGANIKKPINIENNMILLEFDFRQGKFNITNRKRNIDWKILRCEILQVCFFEQINSCFWSPTIYVNYFRI